MNFNLIFFIILLFPLIIQSESSNQKIFIISSYDENYEYAVRQVNGIQTGLIKGGVPLSSIYYKSYYMDTIMTHTTEADLNIQSKFLMNLILSWNPYVIFVLGDMAYDRVILAYENARITNKSLPNFPFIFCDVTKTNLVQTSSITGISLKEPYQAKLDLALKLNRNASKFAFIFDASESSQYQKADLQKQLDNNTINTHGFEVQIYQVLTFDQFKTAMTQLSNDKYGIIVINAIKLYSDLHLNTTVLPYLIQTWITSNVDLTTFGTSSEGGSFSFSFINKCDSFSLIKMSIPSGSYSINFKK
eukprot:TRINITY_DN17576_c0_g1_i1.p1 TRINITY_DN17576_c0_g1~~TRINITY_DN17576_c0_g1_i1.p1  ORF type:complete len:303 (+),score=22.25 TRINITY_DN17576_c0_g1_i1:3-911(+)